MLGRGLESLIPSKTKINDDIQVNNSSLPDKDEEEKEEILEEKIEKEGEEKKIDRFEKKEYQGEQSQDIADRNKIEKEKFFKERETEFRKGEEIGKDEGRILEEEKYLPISQPVFLIETEKIKPNPYQPRREFDQEKLQELVESIREFGILQPLVVNKIIIPKENGEEVEYQLIAGERRLMAAKILGLERVPVVIKEIEEEREKLEIAIVENLQRKNLNPMEEARAFARLTDEFKMPQREIALRIGKSREAIANTLRLLQLSPEAQKKLEQGEITESHARVILTFSDYSKQNELLEQIIKNQLSVREAQELAQKMARSLVGDFHFSVRRRRERPKREVNPFFLEAARFLEEFLSTPIEILPRGKSGGKIAIRFFDQDHLKEIIKKITERE